MFLSLFQEALNTVRISERDQEHAFQMIASVLWLGNITFQVIDDESRVEVVQSEGELCCQRSSLANVDPLELLFFLNVLEYMIS